MSVPSATTEVNAWPELKLYESIDPQDWNGVELPAILERYIANGACQLQVAHESIALPLFTSLGALLGSGVRIIPKGQKDWVVPPIVWSLVIAPSGQMKTPSLNFALAPMRAYANALRAESEREIASAKAAIQESRTSKKGIKKGNSPLSCLDEVALSLS